MIWSFLNAFPILLLGVAGLVHITELSRLSVITEQSSFFAARSQFVDLNPDVDMAQKSVTEISKIMLADQETSYNESLHLQRDEDSHGTQIMAVDLPFPDTPLLGDILHLSMIFQDRFEIGEAEFFPKPRLTGTTPVPKFISSGESE